MMGLPWSEWNPAKPRAVRPIRRTLSGTLARSPVLAEIECIAQSRCELGEGPLWDAASERLYWFDIKRRRLHWLRPSTAEAGAFDLPMQASAAALRRNGELILATECGLADFAPGTGVTVRQPLEPDLEGFRTNEGGVDLSGAFWWSVMDQDGGRRPGRVYRTGPDGTRRVADGIHIANGLCCSPDGRTMYLADSALQTLYAYELDLDRGLLGPRREFATTRHEIGTPDGAAVDEEGFVWNAQWGAWRIVRYAPDGRIDLVIPMPVEQPSSCAFGGPDLCTLYVTSARDGLRQEALEAQPLAGGVFAIQTQTRGLPLPIFRG